VNGGAGVSVRSRICDEDVCPYRHTRVRLQSFRAVLVDCARSAPGSDELLRADEKITFAAAPEYEGELVPEADARPRIPSAVDGVDAAEGVGGLAGDLIHFRSVLGSREQHPVALPSRMRRLSLIARRFTVAESVTSGVSRGALRHSARNQLVRRRGSRQTFDAKPCSRGPTDGRAKVCS